jgi:hypothetical protein
MSDTRREARGARFDEAIDRAVRDMLDVEPPAGLHWRVMHRIGRPTESFGASAENLASPENLVASAFRRKAVWLAAPLAGAAVIVLAVLAPWRHFTTTVSPAGPAVVKAEQRLVVLPAEAPKPTPSPTTAPIRRTAPTSGSQAVTRGVQDRLVDGALAPADDASAIDPLSPIAPITVAAIRPASITPTEIAISPLAPIAELQIAPLSPPERRD